MSKYTTGELAKLCGVSVRTVQYYDSRNILVPSELSEGGRRLYSDEDLHRMRIICFLREAGISINQIGELFSDTHPDHIISTLLDQQEDDLRKQIAEHEKKLGMTNAIRQELKTIDRFSVDSIGDIAYVMKQKARLKRMRLLTVLAALPVNALEWISIILWITRGSWWLFAVWVLVAVVFSVFTMTMYCKKIGYICPECHTMFQSPFKEVLWAYHTAKMRRLTCPQCGRKGLCIEVIYEKENQFYE